MRLVLVVRALRAAGRARRGVAARGADILLVVDVKTTAEVVVVEPNTRAVVPGPALSAAGGAAANA